MDKRRFTGLVALIVFVGAIAGLSYYDWHRTTADTPVAFAPALSADESIPAGDTPIVPPASLVARPVTDHAAPAPEATITPPPAEQPPTMAVPAPEVATAAPLPAGPPPTMAGPAPEVATAAPPPAGPPPTMAGPAPEVATAAPPPAGPPPTMAGPAPEVAAAAPPPAEPPPTPAGPAPEVAAAAPPPAEPLPNMAAPEPEVAAAPPPAEPLPTMAAPEPEVAAAPPPAEPLPTMAAPEPEVAAAPPPAEPPPTVAAPEPEVAAAAPSAVTGAPAGQKIAAAEPPATSVEPAAIPPISPTFDVVRVEPSGDAVVAGLAAPDSTVEVLDGPTAVATAEANTRGEWAMALDKPLPPGTHDLAIRTTSKDKAITTLSDQRVAVSVPDKKSDDVLVVLNSPDAPSKVLQIPQASPPEVAAAPPPAAEPHPAVPGPEIADAAPPSEPPTPQVAPSEPKVAVMPPQPPPVEKTPPAEAVAPREAPAEPRVAESPPLRTPSAAADTKEPEVAMAPVSGPSMAPAPESSVAPASQPEPARAPVAASEQPPKTEPAPQPEVTVAAVEADTTGNIYVAGTAETNEPVRVYVDNQPIGETKPTEGGTWLVETKRDMPAGTYQVRADQVDKNTGDVIARAEVPFEREVDVATLRPTTTAAAAGGAEMTGDTPAVQTVIIKRGDNLWHIARDLYGHGIRYSTIYEANRDQIRSPHWIYPGQVFVVPAGNANWQN